ncbi:AraC family transcriptional regulator [Prauserella sp. PE36]|uniref:AraC family transcriptional regulator n=1 Tax=Prauserella endophytica TaxID=1592324 RepID=A0ABY2S7H2_9PSEU|nr:MULTISPECIES: helix-turn-helix domain-containing protein [Prauserella]RBM19990.1 AraC family transcriptional regulator [Prauserella sp. PE36]TKG71396.1 AraC family transcriptional regulator [Prauserella endophytica]
MGRDDFAVRAPHPALRPLVTRYIGYSQRQNTLTVHRGLPSRHVTLIISLAEPVRVVGMPRPDQAPGSFAGLVGGMHTGPALIEQDTVQAGIHLELNPLGTYALLGVRAADLSGYVVDLADLGSPAMAALPGRLASAPEWESRFDLLDEVLLGRLDDVPEPAPEISWAWRRMIGAGGTLRVDALAREVGWSRRHFGERFSRELGLSPKQAGRVLRFERAGRLLRAGHRGGLAELAVRCGYHDQAHLTNEWRALAGCPPGTWIAEELPFLQYEAGWPGADSGA